MRLHNSAQIIVYTVRRCHRSLKNHMMPLEKVKELIDDVDILGCEQISFSGGEPFLHKDLVKMVAYAYRKGMR